MDAPECGRILYEGEEPVGVCTQRRHSVHSHVEFSAWEAKLRGLARPFELADFETRRVELIQHAMR